MKIKTTEQLGVVIRMRRKQLRITQKELAMVCGTGQRFIVDVERGKSTCQVGKTLHVLQALGLAVETTIPGSDGVGGHMAMKRLIVCLDGERVGALDQDDSGLLVFRYDAAWGGQCCVNGSSIWAPEPCRDYGMRTY